MSGSLLCQGSFLLVDHTVTARLTYLIGNYNILADAASLCWYLTGTALLAFLNLHFPHRHSYRLFPVPPDVKHNITSTLCNGRNNTASAYAVPVLALLPVKKSGLLYLAHHHPRPIWGLRPHPISPNFRQPRPSGRTYVQRRRSQEANRGGLPPRCGAVQRRCGG